MCEKYLYGSEGGAGNDRPYPYPRHQEEAAKPPLMERTGAKREPDRAKHQDSVAKEFLDHTTPSARVEVAAQLFLDRAATPPLLRRGARITTRLFFTGF